ncbi:MAG: glycoside hydrolase 5 family protein [Acidimicrobiales bacterium]
MTRNTRVRRDVRRLRLVVVGLVTTGLVAVALSACTTPGTSSRRFSASSASTTPVVSTTTTQVAHSAVTYGVDVNQFDGDIGPRRVPQVLSMIREAGATAVRIGGDWPATEPAPGRYNFASVDRLLSLAHADGLTVLFELGNEPTWDATGGNENAPPSDCNSPSSACTSVTSYVSALVSHAAPEGLKYLIARNEPQNFNKNWVGGTAAGYARFQQAVYQAAHGADPGIKVLNGGTESISASLRALANRIQPRTLYEQKVTAFSNSLYSNPSWCDSLDILDIHVGDHGPLYSPQIVDSSEAALQACNGGKHVPVWVTEVGYPSISALQSSRVYQIELNGAYQGGESGQARFLTDTFKALAKDQNVVGIDWTFMIDPNTTNVVPPGTTYNKAFSAGMGAGLAYSSYKTKAAYRAYQAITGASG